MVMYDGNDKIRLFYVGGFTEGNFNDNSGDAWYIVKEYV